MAYNDLDQNQTISFNNLQSGVTQGVFTAKIAIPPGTKQITKTEANTYVNIDTALPTYAAKASNQLVTKEDLSGITSASPYIMYGVAGTAGYKSTDGGNTFTALPGLTSAYTWTGIAGDNTGTYIAVVSISTNLVIYLSSDGGATFTAKLISGVVPDFYPTGVAMSNNGQYIGIAGRTTTGGLSRPILAASSNYGASFTPYTDSANVSIYPDFPSKISVSGNGQYMTAVYSYEVDPGGINNPRPWSFRIYSSNGGASWTRSTGSEFARFFDIALDGTGQNQFLTSDWARPGLFGEEGIKAFVTNDFGATFNERYSNTIDYNSGDVGKHIGFVSATISDNGQVMVGSTNETTITPYYNVSSAAPLVIASSNAGTSFTSTFGYTNAIETAGGTAVTAGITNNYIAMMLNNIGQFNYSTVGGTTFIPKATTARAWKQIYRKALLNTPTTTTTTTPAPPPTYTYLRYNVDINCNTSSPVEVWSYTFYTNGFYLIGGTLYYLAGEPHFIYTTEISGATASSCTPTTTTTTTTTPPSSIAVDGVNNFFGGEIVDVTVNGVTISGVSFPISIGNGFGGTTPFSGVQTVQVYVQNVSPNGCITISADTVNSTNGSGDFSAALTTNINGGVYINCTDGSCV